MSITFEIDGQLVGGDRPYVIAEIGHNHQGDLDQARRLIRAAKDAGASAAKLQKRSNRELFTRSTYERAYGGPNSFGPTYGEHREALEFGWDEYVELQRYARELGITFFATAFDFTSADFLAELGVPAFKIASGDILNLPLIEYVAKMGRPLVVSTGGASMSDVERVYGQVMPLNSQLVIQQCTACYPARPEELNMRVISAYRRRFPEAVIGLSAHDDGIISAVLAYALGMRVIEKHFTLDRSMRGTDHRYSLEPEQMRRMVADLEFAVAALGSDRKVPLSCEEPARLKMGKKLVAARDLPAGHPIAPGDVAIRSPGDGLTPVDLPNVVGKVLSRSVAEDEDLAYDVLEDGRPGDG